MPFAAPPPVVAAANAAPAPTASGLEAYRGASRVLVVSARAADDPTLKRQREVLAHETAGLKERDLVVVELVGTATPAGAKPIDPAAARQATGLTPGRFGVALIGKDGRTALRSARVLTASELFGAVDSMPMRQDEMRARR